VIESMDYELLSVVQFDNLDDLLTCSPFDSDDLDKLLCPVLCSDFLSNLLESLMRC
jgi:hypothetical protein